MKKVIFISAVLLGLSCSTTVSMIDGKIDLPNAITFQGTTYHKVWEDSQPLRLAAEYIPRGQALASWEEMITVHYDYFDQASSLKLFFEKQKGHTFLNRISLLTRIMEILLWMLCFIASRLTPLSRTSSFLFQ
jgi:hypothetical protein